MSSSNYELYSWGCDCTIQVGELYNSGWGSIWFRLGKCMIKVGELYDWGWEAVVVSNYLFMKCNKNKCFRRKYFETSKNRGCGNIFPNSKKNEK